MKIEVNKLPNCLVGLRVHIPADRVHEERTRVVQAFCREARLPGYRVGHVPQNLVERRFARGIEEELRERLLSEGVREAIKREGLQAISVRELKEGAFGADGSFRFVGTVIVEPDIALPAYRGIQIRVPGPEPTEAAVDGALEALRLQRASFEDVTLRPLEMGDFAQVTSTGFLGDRPLTEVDPALPPNVAAHRGLWLQMDPGVFLPGFCQGLIGAGVGEARTLTLALPADSPLRALAGETLRYEVVVSGIRRRVLPALDDAFADALLKGKTLAALREEIRVGERERNESEIEDSKRAQVLDYLASMAEGDLPMDLVQDETRRIVDEIVRANTKRGVPPEALKEHEREIVGGAAQGARRRVMNGFTLLRIARAEKIEVSEEEMATRIARMAMIARVSPDKLREELRKRGALQGLREDCLRAKTLDFLVANATVTVLPPGDVPA